MEASPHASTGAGFCIDRHKPELAELVQKIKTCARDAIESSHDALESAILAGGHLTKAKDRVLAGKWGAWLAENFEFSHGTASDWMRLYQNRTELRELMKDDPKQYMSVKSALQLVRKTPLPPPKTKLQMVKKRCNDLLKEIYSQTPAEGKKSKELLVEHIKDVGGYLKGLTA